MFFWRRQESAVRPGGRAVAWGFTSARTAGTDLPDADRGSAATGPYGGFNLGGHVGDDPGAVERNREALARELGVPRERLLFMAQCHGTDVARVDGPWRGEPPAVDGLVTTRDDLVLAVLVADCVPVLLADPVAGVAGAVHAGRPGMTGGIVLRALEEMERAGATSVRACVGPSVCGRCYEVPEEMRAAAAQASPVSATVSWTGTPAVDVAAGVVDQLASAVIETTWVPGCTRESADLYSYRRARTTGRFAGVVRVAA